MNHFKKRINKINNFEMDAENLQVNIHDVLNYDGRFEKLRHLLSKERTGRHSIRKYNDDAMHNLSDASADDTVAGSRREFSCISSPSGGSKKKRKNFTQRNAPECADEIMMPAPSSTRRTLSPKRSWLSRTRHGEEKITPSLVNVESCKRKVVKYLSGTPESSPEQIFRNYGDVALTSRAWVGYETEDTMSTAESQSTTLNGSKQDGRIFDNWTINLNRAGQMVVKGKLESFSKKFVRSKPIAQRLDNVTVLSITGHKYRLIGYIDDNRDELPAYIRMKFHHGFPPDWENVLCLWRSYVNGGCQPNFKWPRSCVDTDDDCSRVITDITSIPTTATEAQNIAISSREQKKNISIKTHQHNEISIHSNMLLDQAPRTHINTNIPTLSLDNGLINDVEQMKELGNCPVQLDVIDSSKSQDLISQKHVDTICNYLEDLKCPYSYIGTIVRSIDCINHIAALAFVHQNKANNFRSEVEDGRNTGRTVNTARLPPRRNDDVPSMHLNRLDNISKNRDSPEYELRSRKARQKSARCTESNRTVFEERNRYHNTSSPIRVPRNLEKMAYSIVESPELRPNIDEDIKSRQLIEKGRNAVTKTVSSPKQKTVLDARTNSIVVDDTKQTRCSGPDVNPSQVHSRSVDDEISQRSAEASPVVSCHKTKPITCVSSSDESTCDEIVGISKKRGRTKNHQIPKSFRYVSKQTKTPSPKLQNNFGPLRSSSLRPTVLLTKIDEQYDLKNLLRSSKSKYTEKSRLTNDLNQESSCNGTVKTSSRRRVGSPLHDSNGEKTMYEANRTVSNSCSGSKYVASSNSASPKHTSIGMKIRSLSRRRLSRKDENPVTVINNRLEIRPNSDSSTDDEYRMGASGGFLRN